MAEYIKQDLLPFLEETGLLTGAPESDFQNYVQIETLSMWKAFKDAWKGPKKAFVGFSLGQYISWGGVMGERMAERDKAMMAEGGHEWR